MDTEVARTRLLSMAAADQEPVLTSDEIDSLMAMARRVDVGGLPPTDDTWTPTYDLNAAAAEAWRWKAGRVAGQFDFSVDQQRFDRSQKYAACLAMAEHYASKAVVSARISGSLPIVSLPPIPIVVDDTGVTA